MEKDKQLLTIFNNCLSLYKINTMVKIYSIPDCPYCAELKEILTKEGVEFIDVNVMLPENDAEYNQLSQITKSDDVPIVKVGKQLLVPNVSFKSIREAADLTKKFLA
jgi:glutaredoxin